MENDDGFTLVAEPEGPTLVEEVDELLRRLGASGALSVQPRQAGDPSWLIRVGDSETSVLCDAMTLLDTLQELPDGVRVGTYEDAGPSIWAVLRQAAQEEFDLAEQRGFPYPASLATP